MRCGQPTMTTGRACRRRTTGGPCFNHGGGAASAPSGQIPSGGYSSAVAQHTPASATSAFSSAPITGPQPGSTTTTVTTAGASTLSSELARRLGRFIPARNVKPLVELVAGWLVNPHMTIDALAGAIVDELPEKQRNNWTHVLCEVIGALKQLVSVEDWIDAFAKLLRDALEERGVPRALATAATTAAASALKTHLANLSPEQLQLTLTCIALIVCPGPEKCPERNTNFAPLTTEGVAATLESLIPQEALSRLQLDRDQKSS